MSCRSNSAGELTNSPDLAELSGLILGRLALRALLILLDDWNILLLSKLPVVESGILVDASFCLSSDASHSYNKITIVKTVWHRGLFGSLSSADRSLNLFRLIRMLFAFSIYSI